MSSLLGQNIGRYRIVGEIGAGGMGVVYRAHDERLERDLALKVLSPGTLNDEAARKRFRKEALILSRLSHPAIQTIIDFDSAEGVDFLVCELVPGITLEEKIRAARLSPKEATRLGIQLAQGLAASHAAGVLHRDLKPANLKITPDGRLKILDFGLATLSHQAVMALSTTASIAEAPSAMAGTLPYMAPEQLLGERLDERSDIHAAGAVFYEMITGQRPFPETIVARLTNSILNEMPPPPRALNGRVSAELERIVLKCLDKDPGLRYQSATELGTDLQRLDAADSKISSRQEIAVGIPAKRKLRLTAVVLIAVALVAIFLLWFFRPGQTFDSIAVLPFANNTGNPGLEYLSDGLTESVINNLAQAPGLKVMSRNSVFHYKGREIDSQKTGRELGVRGLLLGAIQQRGEDLVVSLELVDTNDNRHLWGEQYTRKSSDTLGLQQEISREVTERLGGRLNGETQKPVTKHYTENNEAYLLYLRGQYQLNKRTTEGFRNGAEFFRQAIEKDPTYALAYIGLSSSYGLLKFYGGIAPRDANPKQSAAVAKALELDDSLAEAHASLGFLKDSEWDPVAAEKEFRRAIELNQNSANAHHGYSMLLSTLGRSEEALEQNRRVQELDPLWPAGKGTQVWIYVYSRDYDKAIPAALSSIASDPNFPPPHWALGLAYEAKGNYKAAIQEFQRAEELSGDSIIPRAMLGHGYAAAGDKTKALKIAQELQTTGEHLYVSPYNIAAIYAGLDEKEQVFAWLNKGFESNDPWLVNLKTDFRFDGLRSDPRYSKLLKKTGRDGQI